MAESQSPKIPQNRLVVDRSGSTYGATIETELSVVEQICYLRRDEDRRPVTLLPWCDGAYDPVLLSGSSVRRGVPGIIADGGTDPAQIRDNLVENFAARTSEVGVHNKPCIIVVFGDVTSGRPAACDISVGIAIYAVVPDCIFLFHDIPTGVVRILQAKGRFKQLLPEGQVRLVVSQYTAWAELPRISYEDLFKIEVATVRELRPDEVALQDGLIVLKDRDNRRSIVLASRTKGSGKTLIGWLKAQQKAVPDKEVVLEDVGGKAQQAISKLLAALLGEPVLTTVADLRGNVRAAHEANLNHYWQTKYKATEKKDQICRENERLRRHAASLEDPDEELFSAGRCGYSSGKCSPKTPVAKMKPPTRDAASRIPRPAERLGGKNPYRRKNSFSLFERGFDTSSDDSDGEEPPLFLASYQRVNPAKQFESRCMLCHTTSALSLLFKLPPPVETPNFPV
ncbi:MAG: hypothetical protein M1839_001020 [Geoglossum umbratile]|nr:MAG: hypothetical protein M1839_001020 [Geoglossum umbratile]